MEYILYIILGAIVLAVLWVIGSYNRLVTMRNRTREAWADIDVQLKRRYDLIPNVVETVKGYAKHESGTLQKVTEARNMAMAAKGTAEKGQAENMLSNTLKTLFAVAESYPDLKANANFLDLQRELADTENKIQAARRFYNTNVRDFNTSIETFPTNTIASPLGFEKQDFFDLDASVNEREPVRVEF